MKPVSSPVWSWAQVRTRFTARSEVLSHLLSALTSVPALTFIQHAASFFSSLSVLGVHFP